MRASDPARRDAMTLPTYVGMEELAFSTIGIHSGAAQTLGPAPKGAGRATTETDFRAPTAEREMTCIPCS